MDLVDSNVSEEHAASIFSLLFFIRNFDNLLMTLEGPLVAVCNTYTRLANLYRSATVDVRYVIV